jgi:hypothetical protein
MYPGTAASSDLFDADPWLVGQSEEGEPVVAGRRIQRAGPFVEPPAFSTGEWHRIRHSVQAVARMIETEANLVAPNFVRSQGVIGVEVIPVLAWGSGRPRVRATSTEPTVGRHDLALVGSEPPDGLLPPSGSPAGGSRPGGKLSPTPPERTPAMRAR